MNDKACFAALIETLNQGFKTRGITNVTVLRSHQPTLQGRPKTPILQLVKRNDTRIGHPFKTNIYVKDSDNFLHREIQMMESTYQISCFLQEDPANEDGLTASDLCNMAANILAHDDGLSALAQHDIRPLRFSPIVNPQFENEKGVYEANPSFDLTLTRRIITDTFTPAVQTLQGKFA